ncbi:hypothetical protein [Halorubrum aethiopicum]|uniref:hypothetical protein n=1 Tax=Halorubrum aethiopicum TaxID=1758255 RepID=UPI000AA4654D|nr:hypothetical protein [Halorubrum aethiopicum]
MCDTSRFICNLFSHSKYYTGGLRTPKYAKAQVTTAMLQEIHMTSIRLVSGSVRLTLPKPLATSTSIHDRDALRTAFQVRCDRTGSDGLGLDITIGDVDDDSTRTMSAVVYDSTGQVELRLPRLFTEAWGIDGLDVEWPDADEYACDPDENVTIHATVPEWEPAYPVDLFRAAGEMPHSTSLNRVERSDSDYAQVTGSVPTVLSESIGLGAEYDRVEVTMDCVDGRAVMVMTPTDTPAEEVRNSVAINLAGGQNTQRQFNAGSIAGLLGVEEQLREDGSVRLRWFRQDDSVCAFVEEDGASA